MSESLKDNLKSTNTWVRGLYMLLFAVLYGLAEVVLVAVAVFQFGAKLITGQTNRRLLNVGQSLGTYIYQIVLFQTFKTEDRPFPFDSWPKGAPASGRPPRTSRSRRPKRTEAGTEDAGTVETNENGQ